MNLVHLMFVGLFKSFGGEKSGAPTPGPGGGPTPGLVWRKTRCRLLVL